MATYTKSQLWKKEESERQRGEGNKIKFIHLRFERGQVIAREKKLLLFQQVIKCFGFNLSKTDFHHSKAKVSDKLKKNCHQKE